eukprot:309300-Prymnesium_polylepis.2
MAALSCAVVAVHSIVLSTGGTAISRFTPSLRRSHPSRVTTLSLFDDSCKDKYTGCTILELEEQTQELATQTFYESEKWPRCTLHSIAVGEDGCPIIFLPGFGVGSFHFERNLAQL